MKNKRTTKIIAGALVMASMMTMNPVGASAAWKQNSTGWWYTEGNSWATGWRTIGGQTYYFYSNGYMATNWVNVGGKWYYFYADGSMAKNSWIDGYYVGEDGAMVEYVGFDKMKLSDVDGNGRRELYNQKTRLINSINSVSIDGTDYYDKLEGTHILGYLEHSAMVDSDYIFNLDGKYSKFTAIVGIDDASSNKKDSSGKITFIVDGNVVHEEEYRIGDKVVEVNLDLTNKSKLIIRAHGNRNFYYDILDGKFYFK